MSDSNRQPTSKADSTLPLHTSCPYTFTQIIDADHFTIQRLAGSIRKAISSTLPSPTEAKPPTTTQIRSTLGHLNPPLLEATWRLIRHDFSEEMVMRPAFASVLGEEGRRMAEHDRMDHENGRQALISVLAKLESLNKAGAASGTEVDFIQNFQEMAESITSTLDDLGKHMAIESGEFLPHFESIIDKATSTRLAEEYAATLVLSPFVMSASSFDADHKLVFKDVRSYIMTPLAQMRQLYNQHVANAAADPRCLRHMESDVEKEIERLQVGRWPPGNGRGKL